MFDFFNGLVSQFGVLGTIGIFVIGALFIFIIFKVIAGDKNGNNKGGGSSGGSNNNNNTPPPPPPPTT